MTDFSHPRGPGFEHLRLPYPTFTDQSYYNTQPTQSYAPSQADESEHARGPGFETDSSSEVEPSLENPNAYNSSAVIRENSVPMEDSPRIRGRNSLSENSWQGPGYRSRPAYVNRSRHYSDIDYDEDFYSYRRSAEMSNYYQSFPTDRHWAYKHARSYPCTYSLYSGNPAWPIRRRNSKPYSYTTAYDKSYARKQSRCSEPLSPYSDNRNFKQFKQHKLEHAVHGSTYIEEGKEFEMPVTPAQHLGGTFIQELPSQRQNSSPPSERKAHSSSAKNVSGISARSGQSSDESVVRDSVVSWKSLSQKSCQLLQNKKSTLLAPFDYDALSEKESYQNGQREDVLYNEISGYTKLMNPAFRLENDCGHTDSYIFEVLPNTGRLQHEKTNISSPSSHRYIYNRSPPHRQRSVSVKSHEIQTNVKNPLQLGEEEIYPFGMRPEDILSISGRTEETIADPITTRGITSPCSLTPSLDSYSLSVESTSNFSCNQIQLTKVGVDLIRGQPSKPLSRNDSSFYAKERLRMPVKQNVEKHWQQPCQNIKSKSSVPVSHVHTRDLLTAEDHKKQCSDPVSVPVNRIRTDGMLEPKPLLPDRNNGWRSRSPPKNRIKEHSQYDPTACERKPYAFLLAPPVETGVSKYKKKLDPIPERPVNPGFTPNYHADSRPVNMKSMFKPMFHPKLGHMIDWQHPDYYRLTKRRRKISPSVGFVMQSCAVFAKGPVGSWGGTKPETNPDSFEVDNKLQEPTKRAPIAKFIADLAKDAPKFLNHCSLEYLRTDWNENVKYTLPDHLEAIRPQDELREKLVKLRYIVQAWKIGARTEMEDSWMEFALLSFSGDELRLGISHRSDWQGLTEFLQTVISFCQGHPLNKKHELWEEHDVLEIANNFAKDSTLAVKFSGLDSGLSYNEAPSELQLILLKAVNCEVKQKGSWWENGHHCAYVCFQWPEGLNLAYYHVVFDVETGDVLKKWQYHYKRKIKNQMNVYNGRLIYCGDIYNEERLLFEAASDEIPKLRSDLTIVLEELGLKKVTPKILSFWKAEMALLLFRVLQKRVVRDR